MKDRLSKYPGRVKLTPVAGQADTFDMIRADEPEEAGTPINKQTLLTDKTAEMLGLDNERNKTPDKAFAILAEASKKGAWKIGDIIETVRDDLGEEWLLCNGEGVPEGELHELREVLPYNTEWRPMAMFKQVVSGSTTAEYNAIKPLPLSGKWCFLNVYNYSSSTMGQKAAVYDAYTDAFTEFDCPTVDGSITRYGITALTHDGSRYILCVSEGLTTNTEGRQLHFFTSTDLLEWTQKSTIANYTKNFKFADMYFDGSRLMLMESYYISSSSTDFYISHVDIDTGSKTKITSFNTESYSYYFGLLPEGYWLRTHETQQGLTVYSSSTDAVAFSFSSSYYTTHIAFFNERYWIGMPASGNVATSIQIADLNTNTKSTLSASSVTGQSASGLVNAEFDKNTNEWVFYLKTTGTIKYFAARISADSDPTIAANYRVTQIEKLPEFLSYIQMTPDRAQMYVKGNTERYLRDPNQKYLPTHDGETYKYIYKGGPTDTRVLELEYIESTGAQYIDTGIIGRSGLEFYLDFEYTSPSVVDQAIIGARNGTIRIFPVLPKETNSFIGYGNATEISATYTVGVRYNVYAKFNNGDQIVERNGETIYQGTASGDKNTGLVMPLFALNVSDKIEYFSSIKLWSCKILMDGIVVADLVPCRTMVDNKVRMYDRITGEYRDNAGAGEFVAGPIVRELEMEETV